MQNRNPAAVFFLSLITLGIYAVVWSVKTKNEMNKLGSDIPTAWLLIIPIVSIYWEWRYSKGVEKVTNGKTSSALSFLLLFFLGIIGMAILQNEFNKVSAAPLGGPVPNNGPVPQLNDLSGGAMPNPSPVGPPSQPTAPPPVQPIMPTNEPSSVEDPQDQGPGPISPQNPPSGPLV